MSYSFRRPLHSLVALALAGLFASAGCATDDEARRVAEDQERLARAAGSSPRPKHRLPEADPMPGMNLDSEMGVLETADVEDALQARFEDVRACYQRAGKAQEYAGG